MEKTTYHLSKQSVNKHCIIGTFESLEIALKYYYREVSPNSGNKNCVIKLTEIYENDTPKLHFKSKLLRKVTF